MHISRKFSLSIFLMVVLIQTAVTVPVENKNELQDVKHEFEDVLFYMNPVEINKRLKEMLENLSSQKLTGVDELSQTNLVETYKNLTDSLLNLVQQESTEVKVKVHDFLKRIIPVETKKKLYDLLDELSNQNLAETYKKISERLTNMFIDHFTDIKVRTDDFLAQMKLAEAKKNMRDLFDEFTNQHLAAPAQELKRLLTNLVKEDLYDIETKIDDFLNYINSDEINNYLNELLAKLSNKQLAATFKNLADQLKLLVKQELTNVKAMIDDFLSSKKRTNGKGTKRS